ncbi:MAG: RNHCP domain-containing protein [Spirochaetales bacterium]|nr:RNHCP domain-containing protein [Spirochaetales bacterium]
MSRHKILRENPGESFICLSCGKAVTPLTTGGMHRNHCPHCLCSVHVDLLPGDRRSSCRGVMAPISLWVREDGECSVLHRCRQCGVIKSNRVAADDSESMLLSIAVTSLNRLPFPVDNLKNTVNNRRTG